MAVIGCLIQCGRNTGINAPTNLDQCFWNESVDAVMVHPATFRDWDTLQEMMIDKPKLAPSPAIALW